MMFDISCRKNARDMKDLASIYQRLARQADVCIFGHPYLFSLAKKMRNGQLLIYDAVDVELLVKRPYYQRSGRFEELISLVREAEHDACKNADMVLATNDIDKRMLSELYSVPTSKIRVVPNTVDTSEFVPVVRDEVQAKKEKMGFFGRTVLFSGSLHPPNIEAVDFIIDSLAPRHQDWQFLLSGSICDHVRARLSDRDDHNVRVLGVLKPEQKARVYGAIDVAINPMQHGSGTSVKMLVYMAAGLPVVTTLEGARGLDIVGGQHAIVCDLASFDKEMARLINDATLCDDLAKKARTLVESRYDSTNVASRVAQFLTQSLQ